MIIMIKYKDRYSFFIIPRFLEKKYPPRLVMSSITKILLTPDDQKPRGLLMQGWYQWSAMTIDHWSSSIIIIIIISIINSAYSHLKPPFLMAIPIQTPISQPPAPHQPFGPIARTWSNSSALSCDPVSWWMLQPPMITGDGWNPINNGINHLSTDAGFRNHPQYHDK